MSQQVSIHVSNQQVVGEQRGPRASASRAPKLLLLAWQFPPANAIASVRTWNLAKYLSRLGWRVTVLTPAPRLWRHVDEDVERIESELKRSGIQRITTDHYWRFLAPSIFRGPHQGMRWFMGGVCRRIAQSLGVDRGIGWIGPAEKACRQLIPDDVDLILASGPPFASFGLAQRLAQKLDRPYVLDYRDPWSELPGMIRFLCPLVARQEAKLLAPSAAVTTVSPSKALDLRRQFKQGPEPTVITNAYDLEEMENVQATEFGHFAIVYAGIFYPPKRVITPVMAALKVMKERGGPKLGEYYLHYYGDYEAHVKTEADRFGVADRVVLHGRVQRNVALSALKGAALAIVITSVLDDSSLRTRGIVPGKLFEIMGLGTPILLLAPAGSDAELIANESGLARSFRGSDVQRIADYLAVCIKARCRSAGPVRRTYAWQDIGREFDALLRSVLPTKASKEN